METARYEDVLDWDSIALDLILPSQLKYVHAQRQPEWEMVLTAFSDGIQDLFLDPSTQTWNRRRRDYVFRKREALRWLVSDATEPFSFRWCVEVLYDGPDLGERIRKALLLKLTNQAKVA